MNMHLLKLKTALPMVDDYAAGSKAPLHISPKRRTRVKQNSVSKSSDEPLALVVDDSEDDRLLIARALRSAGFRVAEAATGDAALTAFGARPPQIVLLDLLMPVMDGLNACRLLRAQTGDPDLPILIFSDPQDAATIQSAYDAGATDFLAKPGAASRLEDYAALVSRIHCLLNNKHLNASNRIE
jgi:PleD family two-component response regulator